jgi:tetratricopeptide (TPR) repeat protein
MNNPESDISKYCSYCGAPILEQAKFCGGCGRFIPDSDKSNPNNISSEENLKKKKLFSESAVLFGSLIGGPLATGLLMSKNYKTLNKPAASRVTLILAIAISVIIFILFLVLPVSAITDLPLAFLPVIYAIIAGGIFQFTQKTQVISALRAGGERESGMKIIGFTMIGFLVTAVIAIIINTKNVNEFDSIDFVETSSLSSFSETAGIREYNKGCEYQADGDVLLAERQFKWAIEKNPNLSEAYLNLGLIYLENDLLDLGEEMTLKSIELLKRFKKTIVYGSTYEQTLSLAYNNLGVIEMDRYLQFENDYDDASAKKSWEKGMDFFYEANRLDPENSITNGNIRKFANLYPD